ncbi:acanthoscurrin-1-like [Notolabrus celidotus]|uniref:acanthoscurrin-1-like n=1 Tax=Notolabrus celidotus TaxID=1203425 RepID=UPI00148FE5DC|nr:acanthoscurrin-1-like [Notolabrus celidotus]
MRVLMVVCLLIGSISSVPVWKEQGAGAPGLAATSHMAPSYPVSSLGSGRVESSGLGSSSSLPSYVVPSAGSGSHAMVGGGTGGYAGGYASPWVGGDGAGYAPSAGYDASATGGGYGGGYGGAGSHGFAPSTGGDGWSSESTSYNSAGDESSGPIFSDVSDLDPVYAFSSRSRYQRGRAVFAQSRYTPGEALVQPMPIYRPVIKNPVMLSIPVQEPVKTMPVKAPQQILVQAPTKGGY